jgi:peptidoglycan hydrolase CwlO-like protein
MSEFPPIVEAAIDNQNAIQALETEISEKTDEITILKNKVKELQDDLTNCTFEIGCLREGFDPTTGRDLVFTKPDHP